MIADERQVRIAARLNEMRDTARRLLGVDYSAKMLELGAALTDVAEKTRRQPLAVAIEAARNADGLAQCYILAAAVELAESGSAPRCFGSISALSVNVRRPHDATATSPYPDPRGGSLKKQGRGAARKPKKRGF